MTAGRENWSNSSPWTAGVRHLNQGAGSNNFLPFFFRSQRFFRQYRLFASRRAHEVLENASTSCVFDKSTHCAAVSASWPSSSVPAFGYTAMVSFRTPRTINAEGFASYL